MVLIGRTGLWLGKVLCCESRKAKWNIAVVVDEDILGV